ncbi:hypothetical protein D3C84_812900 [compost metagenome]
MHPAISRTSLQQCRRRKSSARHLELAVGAHTQWRTLPRGARCAPTLRQWNARPTANSTKNRPRYAGSIASQPTGSGSSSPSPCWSSCSACWPAGTCCGNWTPMPCAPPSTTFPAPACCWRWRPPPSASWPMSVTSGPAAASLACTCRCSAWPSAASAPRALVTRSACRCSRAARYVSVSTAATNWAPAISPALPCSPASRWARRSRRWLPWPR